MYIGIDNGVTGSICIINVDKSIIWYKTPVFKQLSYTKKKQWITRIDSPKLYDLLNFPWSCTKLLIERPMMNPTRWKASCSAIRALEATLIIIERLRLPYAYIDSKEWQKAMLPAGLKKEELKAASKDVAQRLFPSLKFTGDGDGILIAEYSRRKYKES